MNEATFNLVSDLLAALMRLVVEANARQTAWMYSLEYTIGKYVSVTRRPWVIEKEYAPVDVTGKDVRADDPEALTAAFAAVRRDVGEVCRR